MTYHFRLQRTDGSALIRRRQELVLTWRQGVRSPKETAPEP